MDKHPIIVGLSIIVLIGSILGAGFSVAQYLLVTPLERENAVLKEKLKHTSEKIEGTHAFKKVKSELDKCAANKSFLEEKTSDYNNLNFRLASSIADNNQLNEAVRTYKNALDSCQVTLSKEHQVSSILSEIKKLQEKQDALEEKVQSERKAFQPRQVILNGFSLRIQRIQEQIKALSLSLSK